MVEFLEHRFPAKPLRPGSAYRLVFDEIRRKTAVAKTYESFEELKNAKGFGRSNMIQLLELIQEEISARDKWPELSNLLLHCGCSHRRLASLQAEYQSYITARMDPNNQSLEQLVRYIRNHLVEIWDDHASADILELSNIVQSELELEEYREIFSEDFIRICTLMEALNSESLSSPTTKLKG